MVGIGCFARCVAISTLAIGAACAGPNDGRVIDLSGKWRLALDRKGVGVDDRWYEASRQEPYTQTARLPGSLAVQEIGDPVTLDTPWVGEWEISGYRTRDEYAPYRPPNEVKLPFWLTPTTYYSGSAWYRRTFTVPRAWEGQRVTLHLERCHWTTQAWIDGESIGEGWSLSAPHEFSIDGGLSPGEHTLVLRIDNRQHLNVGPNSHSVSDHTQGNWNGALGAIELRATPRVWVDKVRVEPAAGQARVKITMASLLDQPASGSLRLEASLRGAGPATAEVRVVPVSVPKEGKELSVDLPLGPQAKLWDEFSPNLYDLRVTWRADGAKEQGRQAVETVFGLRDVGVEGTQITVNGRPIMLRGTLDCCVFPLTGHPPMEVAEWKRVLGAAKAHGLNHIRFHSYCPPEAAFVAADELGVYFQVECASWANQGAEIGAGRKLDAFIYREAQRILDAYGNHPSLLLMAYGNEPAGNNQNAFLAGWIGHFRKIDDRRLYTGAAGWPIIDANEYHVPMQPRIQGWGQQLKSRINASPPETQTDYRAFVRRHPAPVVSHEIGQWCVFPNLAERSKYTGHLKAKNFDIFADQLKAAGMADQAEAFLMASGKLQVLCYKEEIESALRTPGFGGFQLLGLSDFSGQGTALVGVLDAFWDAKPYVGADEFRRFCGPVVPLARLPKRVFTSAETISAEVDLANFGPEGISDAKLRWRLVNAADGAAVAGGDLSRSAPAGRLTRIGRVTAPASAAPAPCKLTLVVSVEGTDIENDWDLWVYPSEAGAAGPDVLVTRELDQEAQQRLADGGLVLLTLPAERVKTDQKLGFSSIFWNTAWTDGQAPHTLGVLCDPSHPVFKLFPTEGWSNWQWWDLINGGAALDLSGLGDEIEPLIQVVPDWFHPKRLALAFEARVGSGRLLVTSANVTADQADRPASRQLLRSLLSYMAGDSFRPTCELRVEDVQSLLK
ncbi:Beta-glucuronidase [Pirellulimonas nuda]|uniref:Beta-glucuronidase n=1 Tax=Pirellulimonas nuda TaxID=2528009 RepID=A0A518DBI2_9BACT|nr:sugar-binding domain-containing protein [Pirellulimonas nuda]QDU88832.1 Beta-glucuronidase [Pirellulimonas nuda]